MGRVVAAVLLGAMGVALWWFLLREDPADGEVRNAPARAVAPDEAPGLEASGHAPTKRTAAAAVEAPEDASAGAISVPTHVLAGRVLGPPAGDAGRTRVIAEALREHGWVDGQVEAIEGDVGADGRFTLDVSALFVARPQLRSFRAVLDHPDHVALRRPVHVDSGVRGEDGVVGFTVEATLEAAIVVTGTVVDADGPVADATVALFARAGGALAPGEVSGPQAVEEVTTAADGTFRLRAPAPGSWQVVAVTKTALPAGAVLDLDRAEPPPPVQLELRPGLTIAGRVRVNGRPVEQARVAAHRKGPGIEFYLGGRDLAGLASDVVPWDGAARSDADGTFAIAGLDAHERALRVTGLGARVLWDAMTEAVAVTPPAPNVVLDLGGIALDVEVQAEDGPLEDLTVLLSQEVAEPDAPHPNQRSRRRERAKTDARGIARFFVPADTTFDVRIEDDRFAPYEGRIQSAARPGTQAERIDLGAPRALATLVVVLTDEQGEPIRLADFEVVGPNETDAFSFRFESEVRESQDGRYRLEGLEPGARRVICTPGRGRSEFRGHDLGINEPVTLLAGRETTLRLTARRGGRLRVLVTGEDGQPMQASVEVRDGRDEAVSVAFFWGGETWASMSSGNVGAQRSTVEPPLAPGHYVLVVGNGGYTTRRVPVEVEAGVTRDVDVALVKE